MMLNQQTLRQDDIDSKKLVRHLRMIASNISRQERYIINRLRQGEDCDKTCAVSLDADTYDKSKIHLWFSDNLEVSEFAFEGDFEKLVSIDVLSKEGKWYKLSLLGYMLIEYMKKKDWFDSFAPMDTSELFRTVRLSVGDTQQKFAEKIGVTQQAVQKWETGKSIPDTGTLPNIMKAAKCDKLAFRIDRDTKLTISKDNI